MNNKKNIFIGAVMFMFVSLASMAPGQTVKSYTPNDLLEPERLAGLLKEANAKQPVVFNIGPLENIKGAITIGPASKEANLAKLRKALADVPKDKMVVVYCGCCPMHVCPNIKPAFSLAKELGFTNVKILDLKKNLKINWIDEGFPMQ